MHPYIKEKELFRRKGRLFEREHIYPGDLPCQPYYGVGVWREVPPDALEDWLLQGYSYEREWEAHTFPRYHVPWNIFQAFKSEGPLEGEYAILRKFFQCACEAD